MVAPILIELDAFNANVPALLGIDVLDCELPIIDTVAN